MLFRAIERRLLGIANTGCISDRSVPGREQFHRPAKCSHITEFDSAVAGVFAQTLAFTQQDFRDFLLLQLWGTRCFVRITLLLRGRLAAVALRSCLPRCEQSETYSRGPRVPIASLTHFQSADVAGNTRVLTSTWVKFIFLRK